MNLRKTIISLAGLAIFALSLYLSGILGSMAEPPKKMAPKAITKTVKTKPVSYSEVATEIVAYGRVKTAQTLDLISEVSGRMLQGTVPLKEGQSFRRGDLLFKVDDEEARLNLQSQKSNFLKDLAAILPDLKIDFKDNYPAWQTYFNAIDIDNNLPELPEYKSDQEKTFLATRNILSTYYTIKSQEARLKKYRFYAPFSGSIYTVNLHSGSFVNPGGNIARLIRSDKLELKVDVDANEIKWVEIGAEVSIFSEDGSRWAGKVIRMGEFVNQNTQSIDVFIGIDKNTNPLYDGQFLRAVMPSRNIANSMEIPRSILFNQNEVFIVYDTVLKVQKVNVLKVNEETIVMNGLKAGVDLVYEPLVNAYNGMVVEKSNVSAKSIDLEATTPENSSNQSLSN